MSDNKQNTHAFTKDAAARVQATQAKNGGDMSSSGFASRAQAAGDKNANAGGMQGQNMGQAAQGGKK